ncbi:DsbA family oxidoreductase (plasmid) [Rhizobium sp. CB3090]|uniref:DsbA family oxidoreductase n=1 Tax=Rhizobium sp. CB3090 TaxID=3039156 RepID=UPI0024B0944B|nr:DsbA family oxidoreductase [Rhizobium sp. CB3090]WFU13357.1 DsbA family oxidoreductase [Rhizobium sp. CB3090]
MKVEIWSDIACPWCYIAKHRFDAALSQFEHREQVDVIWRSYQLDPDAPPVTNKNLNDILSEKHGLSIEEAVAMNDQMRRLGAREGLDYKFDRARYGNSFDAHRLIHFARSRGVQTGMEERLFRAYFSEGKALGDIDTLVELAGEIGINADEAHVVLVSDAFADQVRADTQTARRLGLKGVPFFMIGEKFGIAGAQTSQSFRDALAQAWMEAHPRGSISGAAIVDAGCCTDDGCEALKSKAIGKAD